MAQEIIDFGSTPLVQDTRVEHSQSLVTNAIQGVGDLIAKKGMEVAIAEGKVQGTQDAVDANKRGEHWQPVEASGWFSEGAEARNKTAST